MRQQRCARERFAARGHLELPAGPVESASEYRRHQPVLPRKAGHRGQRRAGPAGKRCIRLTAQCVELDQRDRGHRVLDQRLDRVAQPAELVASGAVVVAAVGRIRVAVLEVLREVEGHLEPPAGMKPSLVRAHRRQQSPHLVAELAADVLCMSDALGLPVSGGEKGLEQLLRLGFQLRALAPAGRVKVGDGEGRVPRRVNTAVDVRRCELGARGRILRVVVLIGVLAAGEQTRGGVAKRAAEVGGGGVKRGCHSGRGQRGDEAGVVLEHLLEVRHTPVLGRRVPEEPTFDVVVHSTAGHALQRV